MDEIFNSLRLAPTYVTTGSEVLPSCFQVSALAADGFGAVGQAIAALVVELELVAEAPQVRVNQRLAAHWYGYSIQPIGWELPPIWDAIAGDYRCQDGWIKLHTNLRHHREAALSVLKVAPTREAVAQAVLAWRGEALESAITEAGGVAAMMRTAKAWAAHPQGQAVAAESLIDWVSPRKMPPKSWQASLARPLNGLKVLDLTRVLAGPVATRTLAGFGAEVLRLDPPTWEEPNVVPDVTLGKRCARLDLKKAPDRSRFEALLQDADVLVHGYRAGALEALGYGQAKRQVLAPNLIEASLNAYGWTGPWAKRRGFDSLVQMACGIADAGQQHLAGSDPRPSPLPVQALDHATGYLMAAAVIRSLARAARGAGVYNARLSLARTAALLMQHSQKMPDGLSLLLTEKDFNTHLEVTPWGPAHRLQPALEVSNVPLQWNRPACQLGSSSAKWLGSN